MPRAKAKYDVASLKTLHRNEQLPKVSGHSNMATPFHIVSRYQSIHLPRLWRWPQLPMLLPTSAVPSIKEQGGSAASSALPLRLLYLLLQLIPPSLQGPVTCTNFRFCGLWHMSYSITGKQPHYFHLDCFVCLQCNAQIKPKSQLRCTTSIKSASHITLDTYESFARSLW